MSVHWAADGRVDACSCAPARPPPGRVASRCRRRARGAASAATASSAPSPAPASASSTASTIPSQPSEVHGAAIATAAAKRQVSDLNPWWRERTPIRAETRCVRGARRPGRHASASKAGCCAPKGAPGPRAAAERHARRAGRVCAARLRHQRVLAGAVRAAAGRVLALNAVGSASYGREFCQRLAGHWGEYDLPQHLAADAPAAGRGRVRRARRRSPASRTAATSSAWAIGHTDLFRAAVVMAPVGNIETHYGTSDGGYYADPFYIDTEAALRPRAWRASCRRCSTSSSRRRRRSSCRARTTSAAPSASRRSCSSASTAPATRRPSWCCTPARRTASSAGHAVVPRGRGAADHRLAGAVRRREGPAGRGRAAPGGDGRLTPGVSGTRRPAMSSGWPMRPSGVPATICVSISLPMTPAVCVPSVSTPPGAMVLTRIFRGASSMAWTRVTWSSAPFVAP